MKLLVRLMPPRSTSNADDSESVDSDSIDSTSIQSYGNPVLVDIDPNWSLEQQVSHQALYEISVQLYQFQKQSFELTKHEYEFQYKGLLNSISGILKNLEILIRPTEGVRDLIEYVYGNGVVSTGMIIANHPYRLIRGKNDILDTLRKLTAAGILTRYSYHPIKDAFKAKGLTPFASLSRTELFGKPGLSVNAYDQAVDFYVQRTQEAYEIEQDKAKALFERKRILKVAQEQVLNKNPIPKPLTKTEILMRINRLGKDLDYLRKDKNADPQELSRLQLEFKGYERRLARLEQED